MAGTYQISNLGCSKTRLPEDIGCETMISRNSLNYISVTAGKDLSQLAAACLDDKHMGYAWRHCLPDRWK